MDAYTLILAGINALKEYIVLHVLTCLVPALLIAGALMSMINKAVFNKLPRSGNIQGEIVSLGVNFISLRMFIQLFP